MGVVANTTKPAALAAVKELLEVANRQGISVTLEEELGHHLDTDTMQLCVANELAEEVQCLVAFGGDGTILRTARLVAGRLCPILGVNLGRLGFLAEIAPDQLAWAVSKLVAGDFLIDQRMTLTARLDGGEQTLTALNDIVIDKGDQSRIISLDVREDGQWVNTYVADGLIVATPTGSTGYSLAAGGPILKPGVDAMIATPISPHSLTVRPMVFGSDVLLRISAAGAEGKQMRLTADGQESCSLSNGDSVEVGKGEGQTFLVRFAHTSYYDVLRQKMHWGMDKKLR
jgi:NAD+ kinase